jgi:arylsulfatase
VFSGLRIGEWKLMLAATSDDDRDVVNIGGFSGVTQKYTYGRLFNLYLDPKESHSYTIRKLAYVDAFQDAVANHIGSLHGKYPARRPMAAMQ